MSDRPRRGFDLFLFDEIAVAANQRGNTEPYLRLATLGRCKVSVHNKRSDSRKSARSQAEVGCLFCKKTGQRRESIVFDRKGTNSPHCYTFRFDPTRVRTLQLTRRSARLYSTVELQVCLRMISTARDECFEPTLSFCASDGRSRKSRDLGTAARGCSTRSERDCAHRNPAQPRSNKGHGRATCIEVIVRVTNVQTAIKEMEDDPRSKK